MTTNLIVQLSVIATDQLFSTPETCKPSLETIYLTQRYRDNPEAMNTIPIPVCADSGPTMPLPTVVTKRRYEVLGNHHIFFARQKAQCPFALCLRLNQPERNPALWQAELQSKNQPERFDITTLDTIDLAQVFNYLAQNEKGLATLIRRKELIQALAEHPSRPYWSSWDPLKALAKLRKVSITKKHTDCFGDYFYFDPQCLPKLYINTVSTEEISRHLNIIPLETGFINQLSHRLSGSPSRLYWRNFKDMTKALRDEAQFTITKTTQTILAQGFHFTPAPPPVPNTVPFLLQEMTIKALRREAEERGLDHKGKRKADLVKLLSRVIDEG